MILIFSAVIAFIVVCVVDAPSRAQRRLKDKQAILAAIEALQPERATEITIFHEAKRRLGRNIGFGITGMQVHLDNFERMGVINWYLVQSTNRPEWKSLNRRYQIVVKNNTNFQ